MAMRRLLRGAPLSVADAASLAGSNGLLQEHDLRCADLYVASSQTRERAIEPIGRHSILVTRPLLDDMHRGAVSAESVVVGLIHAEVRRGAAGCMRHDVAARVVTLPADALTAFARRIFRIRRSTRHHAAGQLLTSVVVGAAVWQMAIQGLWVLGLITALLALAVAFSRRASRARQSAIEANADHVIAKAGLGDALATLLLATSGRAALARLRAMPVATKTPALRPRRHLHLVP